MRPATLALLAVTLARVTSGAPSPADGDFTYVSAFSIRPPGASRWEPPPGGPMRDGVFTWRYAPGAVRVALTMGVQFSSELLDPDAWTDPGALEAYHERLLAVEPGLTVANRRIGRSSARLDERFAPPAIAREVVLEEVSTRSGEVTGLFTIRSWRFRHPQSPILEFVAELRSRTRPGESVPEPTDEDLAFLSTLSALPLDRAPDVAIPLGTSVLDAIAMGHGSLWVTDRVADTLTRIDLASREAVATIPLGQGPHAVVTTEDAVWVANHNADTLQRIDPVTNRVSATATVPVGPHQLLRHGSGLWLACDASCVVTRIDPVTGQPAGERLAFGEARRSRSGRKEKLWKTLGREPGACDDLSISIASAGEELGVAERFRGTIARLGADGAVRRVDVGVELGPFVVAESDLWGIDELAREPRVYRIDADTGRLEARIEAGRVSGRPVPGGGLLWIPRERENTVVRIDPVSSRLVGRPIPVRSPAAIVADANGVWVAGGSGVVRIPYGDIPRQPGMSPS